MRAGDPPAVAEFDAALAILHKAMSDFTIARAAQQRAALESGDHATAMATAPVALPAGTHKRTLIRWRVSNPAAVPREHLCVNSTSVQAVVNECGLKTQIPGIDVSEEEELRTVKA